MTTDSNPPEPTPEEPGFRVMDLRFWMAIVFMVACLIASGVVGFWGSKIWPKVPHQPAPAVATLHPPATPGHR